MTSHGNLSLFSNEIFVYGIILHYLLNKWKLSTTGADEVASADVLVGVTREWCSLAEN